jgi:hypothetical protein
VKKAYLLKSFPGMLFDRSNPHNPSFLHNEEEFDKEEWPLRMTDPRVLDRFVAFVVSAKFDQITGLPLNGKACVDHMHGLPGSVNGSKDG